MIECCVWNNLDKITAKNIGRHKTHWNIFSSFRRDLWNDNICSARHILHMKPCRGICDFPGSCAFAGQPELPDSFYSFLTLWHFLQFVRGTISQPQAETRATVDKFLRTIPRLKIRFGRWLFLQEFIHFFFGQWVCFQSQFPAHHKGACFGSPQTHSLHPTDTH